MNQPAPVTPSSAPVPLEKTHLRLGFVSLADAAPLVAVKLLEFGHAYGLTLDYRVNLHGPRCATSCWRASWMPLMRYTASPMVYSSAWAVRKRIWLY